MPPSVILSRVAVVGTDVSEECIVSITTLTEIGELGTTLAVTSNPSTLGGTFQFLVAVNVFPSSPILVTLMMEAICSSKTSGLTRATRHHIIEDGILHSHSRENLESYMALTVWIL
jgi:hypothetical protein